MTIGDDLDWDEESLWDSAIKYAEQCDKESQETFNYGDLYEDSRI